MAEHYTKNTVEVAAYCRHCNTSTMHNVYDGKKGRLPGLHQAPGERAQSCAAGEAGFALLMTYMHTTRHAKQACPNCGYTVDASTNTTGTSGPSAGDYSVCINCAQPLVFAQDLSLTAIALADIHEECRTAIAKVQLAIRLMKAQNN
jgi:ribosomal protein L44E